MKKLKELKLSQEIPFSPSCNKFSHKVLRKNLHFDYSCYNSCLLQEIQVKPVLARSIICSKEFVYINPKQQRVLSKSVKTLANFELKFHNDDTLNLGFLRFLQPAYRNKMKKMKLDITILSKSVMWIPCLLRNVKSYSININYALNKKGKLLKKLFSKITSSKELKSLKVEWIDQDETKPKKQGAYYNFLCNRIERIKNFQTLAIDNMTFADCSNARGIQYLGRIPSNKKRLGLHFHPVNEELLIAVANQLDSSERNLIKYLRCSLIMKELTLEISYECKRPSLTSLQLCLFKYKAYCLDYPYSWLAKIPSLEEFRLEFDCYFPDGILDLGGLGHKIKVWENLRVLALSCNQACDARPLFEALTGSNSKLERLELSFDSIKEVIYPMTDYISKIANLSFLKLSGSNRQIDQHLTHAELKYMSTGLRQRRESLRRLYFRACFTQREVFQALGEMIASLSNLEELGISLPEYNFDNLDLKQLSASIKLLAKLRMLEIDIRISNTVNDHDWKSFIDNLEGHNSIREFNCCPYLLNVSKDVKQRLIKLRNKIKLRNIF